MKQNEDEAQKTIEQPTDIENDYGEDGQSEFDIVGSSPDIKLKSIEIDE